MVTIRDPIHADIEISQTERRLLDTGEMQRLRRVKQLAMAYLVYPGANHTRFEHSIGTMELAGRICASCEIEKEKTEQLRIAALLHDLGHVCFSHEGEFATKAALGTHEEIGRRKMLEGGIADILNENWGAGKIAELSASADFGGIISSDIGADRMDYLLRDSHYTGVAYGIIEKERIVSQSAFSQEGLFLREGGLSAGESLLIARFLMFSTVYMHHAVRIASAMLERSLKSALANDALREDFLLFAGDEEVLNELAKTSPCAKMAQRLKERNLYKKAHFADFELLSQEMKNSLKSGQAERELSEKAGADVLISMPQSFVGGTNVLVEVNGQKRKISEISPLVRAMSETEKARSKVLVCCAKEDIEQVARAAKNYFGK